MIVTYDPEGNARWPWRVAYNLDITLPDEAPLSHTVGLHARLMSNRTTLAFVGGPDAAQPYRCDGPTGCPLWLQKWLMARWPEAFLTHDALYQIWREMLVPRGIAFEWSCNLPASAFRRYADRQMRNLIRGGILAFVIRWTAWGLVRLAGGWVGRRT